MVLDLAGPNRPETLGGKKYDMVLIDTFSRGSWVKLLSKKSDAAGVLERWINQCVFFPVLESLDLSKVVDLRDALLFSLSYVCVARAKEAMNIAWRDVTVLGGGDAITLAIRPSKKSTDTGSTHL